MNLKLVIFVVLTTALASFGPGSAEIHGQAAGNVSGTDYESAQKQLDQYFRWIGDMRRSLDRKQFDLDSRLDVLEYDAEKIVEFVTKEVRFEQYSGLLRGAEGTLRTIAGNALDQSVLLAAMLKNAGYDARIVRGRLTGDQAVELLEIMSARTAAQGFSADKHQLENTIGEMWVLTGEDPSALERLLRDSGGDAITQLESYRENVDTESGFILGQLQDSGVKLGDDSLPTRIAEETRDYFWTEYKLEPASGWKAAHPAFEGAEVDLASLEVQQTFADTIPADLQHRLRIEVFVEQKRGGKTQQVSLGGPWEYPVANLVHTPLTFSNFPLSFAGQLESGQIEISSSGNEVLVPIFGGASFGSSFDLTGNIVPLDAALSSYAGVFAEDAAKLTDAASALSSMDTTEESGRVMELVSQTLAISLILPGGDEIHYTRSVYDRERDVDLAGVSVTEAAIKALTQQFTFMVSVGTESEAAVLDASLAGLEAKKGMAENMLAQGFGVDLSGGSARDSNAVTAWAGMPFAQHIINRSNLAGGAHMYRHQPLVVAHRGELPLEDFTSQYVDIIHSQSRLYDYSLNGTAAGARSNLWRGVWESAAEGALLAQEGEPVTADSQFRRYRDAGVDIKVITPDGSAEVANLGLESTAESILKADLERGYAVVVPALPDGQDLGVGYWWRVDPRSGATLGVSETGEGSSLGEYKISQRLIAGVVVAAVGFVMCEGFRNEVVDPGTLTHGDCVGLAMGMGVGAASGSGVMEGIASWAGFAIAVLVFTKFIDNTFPT